MDKILEFKEPDSVLSLSRHQIERLIYFLIAPPDEVGVHTQELTSIIAMLIAAGSRHSDKGEKE